MWGHSCGRSVEGRGCMYDVETTSPLEESEGCPSAVACQPHPGSHRPHCSPWRAPAADTALSLDMLAGTAEQLKHEGQVVQQTRQDSSAPCPDQGQRHDALAGSAGML